MKKIILLLGVMLISFAVVAQTTTSKGVLKNNVLKLNNGVTLSKGDTIMLGTPANDGNQFTFIQEPKHAFGLLGGNGADKKYMYRMLIIKFFTTANDKNSSEKKFVASLGYNAGDEVILDCDIAEAIDNGEVVAKGRIPKKFDIPGKSLFLYDVLREIKEELADDPAVLSITMETVKERVVETTTEKPVARIVENTVTTTENPVTRIIENPVTTITEKSVTTTEQPAKISATSLLNKINTLQKNGYINTNEHYQLLKVITGSGEAEGKKELIRKLQNLRNDNRITMNEYDELVDLLL